MIKVVKTKCNFERETLKAPFGFKGGYTNDSWQIVASMESESGHSGIGLGKQGILWSDPKVFTDYGEITGNSMMFSMTGFALQAAKEISFDTPIDLLDKLIPIVYEYGKKITNNPDLHLTYVLNALVAVDNAAWTLYCKEKGITNFDDMIPHDVRPALSHRHTALACIPLITYGLSLEQIKEIVDDGYFFLKLKIGSNPDSDNDYEKMLEWDKKRLLDIHTLVKDKVIPYTQNGYIPYYLDANGRYPNKTLLLRLLDYADKIGALERILIVEEPFPEEYKVNVQDIPVRLASDESAHSDKDVLERINLGYKAIALKPIAKTMSMSFKMAKIAHENNITCFCADLTVNPSLVDWNKNVAARLSPLPGMNIGVIETNGHQNYLNWETMKSYHPCYGAKWIDADNGIFNLDSGFYKKSGGIFTVGDHYADMVK